ncbi:MAG: DUF362 domain-containing protein, partial [Candidatus Syntropharchaeia archaeon]
MVEKSFENVSKVLVKPNIVSFEPYPTTTHPEVLRTSLECLSDKDVVVADGPAPDAGSSKKILKNHPLKKVCDEFGIPLVNIYEEEMVKIKTVRGFELKLSKLPFQFDFILSLPVLKSHKVTDITGALKNQFGFLSKKERILFHTKIGKRRAKDIHRGIAELNTIVLPDLFIVDAVYT